jgi:hypothetical protein
LDVAIASEKASKDSWLNCFKISVFLILTCFIHLKLILLEGEKVSRRHGAVIMTVILATQEAEIRRIMVQSQHSQIVHETLSQIYLTQKMLAEWLKVKVLSSSPSTTKK